MLQHGIQWDTYLPLGPYAVRLFFVLSGFLITGILLRARDEGSNTVQIARAFYARRFLRIFPLYYLSLAVLCILGEPTVRQTLLWHVLYGSNILAADPEVTIQPIWGHLWSLSVEEQFYLIWPALILLVPRAHTLKTLFLIVLIGPLFRLTVVYFWHFRPAVYLTPSCLDSLGLGALLAWMSARRHLDGLRARLCQAGLLVGTCIVALAFASAYSGVGMSLRIAAGDFGVSLCSCWLVNQAVRGFDGWFGKLLEWRGVVFIGVISYGVYLLHNFVPYFAEVAGWPLPSPGILRFTILAPITVGLASLSWYCFESPLNQLKDYFPYVARRAEVVSETALEAVAQSK